MTPRTRRWLRRLVLLLVVGVVAFGVWAVGWSSLLGVRHVDVSGEHRTSEQVVLAAGAVHVKVSRVWPRTVRITITERVPVAVVHRGSSMRLIDAAGVDFAGAPPGAPYPKLDLNLATTPAADVQAALAVVHALPGPVLRRVASVQAYNPTDVRLILTDGAIVIWGSADRTLDKAQVFAALERQHPKATTYDVSAPDAPAVKR